MALAPLSQTIFLTEDGSAVASPKAVTIPPLVAVPPVTLGTLTLSDTLTAGTPSSGTILGATAGSTISDSIVGLSIDSDDLSYTWDGTGRAGTFPEGLIETHPNATNSGRASAVTVSPATPAPSNQITAGGEVMTVGGEPLFAGVY